MKHPIIYSWVVGTVENFPQEDDHRVRFSCVPEKLDPRLFTRNYLGPDFKTNRRVAYATVRSFETTRDDHDAQIYRSCTVSDKVHYQTDRGVGAAEWLTRDPLVTRRTRI